MEKCVGEKDMVNKREQLIDRYNKMTCWEKQGKIDIQVGGVKNLSAGFTFFCGERGS